MATLVCDLCGGKLVMGSGGIATCNSCGMEHSSERMKEKLQEANGGIQSPNAPAVGNTQLIENYIQMAQSAYASDNKAEAETYCNKIIEITPNHQKAWLIKGKAAGWQSTLNNIRFPEAINCFANALKYTAEEEKDAIIDECKQEVSNLAEALLLLRSERFAKWPDEDEKIGFVTDLTAILKAILQFFEATGTLIDSEELMAPLAVIINNSVMAAWNTVVVPTFANDRGGWPDDYEITRLIERGDHCADLLERAIGLTNANDQGNIQRYKNLIGIHEYLINAWSYSYETVFVGYSGWDGSAMYDNKYVQSKSLTDEAKRQRRNLITQYRSKIRSIESAIAAKEAAEKAEKERIAAEKERIAREAAQKRREEYWANHPEEKNALETEKKELNAQINMINTALDDQISALTEEINTIPEASKIAALDERIQKLTTDKAALGIFKGKEKKAIQEQIEQAEADKIAARDRMAAAKKEIEDKIYMARQSAREKRSELERRIFSINEELKKDRR